MPGVHLAKLGDGAWYCSTKRFRDGKDDEAIITKGRGATADEAIMEAYRILVQLFAEYDARK